MYRQCSMTDCCVISNGRPIERRGKWLASNSIIIINISSVKWPGSKRSVGKIEMSSGYIRGPGPGLLLMVAR